MGGAIRFKSNADGREKAGQSFAGKEAHRVASGAEKKKKWDFTLMAVAG
jgi:hypothetical protein